MTITYSDLIGEIEKLKTNVEDLSIEHKVLPEGIMQEIDGYNYAIDVIVGYLNSLKLQNIIILNKVGGIE